MFQPGDHGSTYSGTALATAAVSAVVDEMRRIDAPGLARKQGGQLTSLLEQIPQVSSVRGAGLRYPDMRHRRDWRNHQAASGVRR